MKQLLAVSLKGFSYVDVSLYGLYLPMALPMEGLSQDQIFHTSRVPGRTTHGHLPLVGSAVDGRYRRSSDPRGGLHLHPQVSKEMFVP